MNRRNLVKWAKSRVGSNRRSRKGISVIMANLTMLIIVVFLSALLFTWAVTSFGLYQGGAGFFFSSKSLANQERISVENVYFGTAGGQNTNVSIFYRNVGAIPVTVATIYFSSNTLNVVQNISPQKQLGVQNVTSIILLLTPNQWQACGLYTAKLATLRGTTVTTTWVAPSVAGKCA